MESLMQRALKAAHERTRACGDLPEAQLSGFEIDQEELVRAAREHTVAGLALIGSGVDVQMVLDGLFTAGYLTAMHYERLRREVRCVSCGGPASALSGRIVNPDGSHVHACGAECASEYLLLRRDAA